MSQGQRLANEIVHVSPCENQEFVISSLSSAFALCDGLDLETVTLSWNVFVQLWSAGLECSALLTSLNTNGHYCRTLYFHCIL